MAVTKKRLVGPGLLTNAYVTKMTVPALTKTIIRHIHLDNTDSAARTFSLSIGAGAAATELFSAKSIAANDVFDWYCYLVMDVGEILQALASVTTVVNLVVDGDEITLG